MNEEHANPCERVRMRICNTTQVIDSVEVRMPWQRHGPRSKRCDWGSEIPKTVPPLRDTGSLSSLFYCLVPESAARRAWRQGRRQSLLDTFSTFQFATSSVYVEWLICLVHPCRIRKAPLLSYTTRRVGTRFSRPLDLPNRRNNIFQA